MLARFWHDSLKARELALRHSRRACQDTGVQLLDETVALARLGLAREPASGRLRLRREYGFEFSREGDERRKGMVSILAGRVELMHLDLPDGPVVVTATPPRRPGD